jgi:hypothetical protein
VVAKQREKPGGHELVERAVRQHVAGDLLGGELVPRHVVLERADHPVAVRPDGAVVVDVDAMGVGIARGIQPVAGEVLGAGGGGEQIVRRLFNGRLPDPRAGVFKRRPRSPACRRQAREIEVQPPVEPRAGLPADSA